MKRSFSGKSQTSPTNSKHSNDVPVDLEEYFGMKAEKHMQSIVRGRHPKSIPRDSELWHYSKLSSDRRARMNRGHSFFKVIEDDCSMKSGLSNPKFVYRQLIDNDDYTINTHENSATAPSSKVQTTSVSTQVKQMLSKASGNSTKENLQLRVDFKKKSQINYGMSFIIMNCNDELLYVNKFNELRCKPLKQIEPTDRIKFKMIDLVNPSNPSSLKYGDSMWLQCLDASEAGDNSFQAGHVITAKLYGPPELKSVQFDINAYSKPPPPPINGSLNGGTDTSEPSNMDNVHLTAEELKQVRIRNEQMKNFTGGNGFNVPMFGADNTGDSPHRRGRTDTWDDNTTVGGGDTDTMNGDEETVDGMSPSAARRASFMPDTKAQSKKTEQTKKEKAKASHQSNVARICGEVEVTRIIEIRKNESQYAVHDSATMSDEKATRYNSKQSTHLGRWAVHSALRNDDQSRDADKACGRKRGGPFANAQSKHPSRDAVADPFVYSLSPIVIQQDLYCLGAAHPKEFHKWPLNSHSIIHKSESISQDEAAYLNDFYEKNGGAGKGGSRYVSGQLGLHNAAVSGAIFNNIASGPGAPITLPPVTNGAGFGGQSGGIFADKKSPSQFGSPTKSIQSSSSGFGLPTSQQTAASAPAELSAEANEAAAEDDMSDAGCLRKLVQRGFPYDYSVDRKCVWKICLFEQFSDNTSALSEKEKSAKKVMETASMVLKLSQMNREGARTHIAAHHLDHHTHLDLPPLVGGESFSKNLREITFKNMQIKEQKVLNSRRRNEAQLKEYFHDKINQVLEKEVVVHKYGMKRANSMKSLSINGGQSISSNNLHSLAQSSQYSLNSAHSPGANSSIGTNKVSFANDFSSFSPSKRTGSPNKLTFYTESESNSNKSSNSLFSGQSGMHSGYNDDHNNDNMSVQTGVSSLHTQTTTNYTNNRSGGNLKASKSVTLAAPSDYDKYNATLQSRYGVASPGYTQGGRSLYGASSSSSSDGYHRSAEIQAVFNSNVTRIDPKALILSNSDSLLNYDKLSEGEKVLALHKTYSQIKTNASDIASKVKLPPNVIKPKLTSSVKEKWDRLVAEDAQIASVLSYKDRLETMKKTMLYEEEQY